MNRQTLVAMLGALPTAKAEGTTFTFDKGRAIALHIGSGDTTFAIREVERVDCKDTYVEIAGDEGKLFLVPMDEVRWVSARPATPKAKAGFVA